MSEPCRSRRGEEYEVRDDEKQDKSRASQVTPGRSQRPALRTVTLWGKRSTR